LLGGLPKISPPRPLVSIARLGVQQLVGVVGRDENHMKQAVVKAHGRSKIARFGGVEFNISHLDVLFSLFKLVVCHLSDFAFYSAICPFAQRSQEKPGIGVGEKGYVFIGVFHGIRVKMPNGGVDAAARIHERTAVPICQYHLR
jgi:hypothetical protein